MTTTTSIGTQTNEDLYLSRERSRSSPQLTGHSGRLKYADPKDLPSYPSLGLKKNDAAAGAAASLGWANAKPLTIWSPPKDNLSAQRAATLANTQSLQSTTMAATDSQAAAASALSSSPLKKRASMPPSVWGNSAANQAFAAQMSPSNAAIEPREPMTSLNRQKSLRAAQEAVAGKVGRPRSRSTPLAAYPDSANAAANALSAATIATRPSTTMINIKMEDAGALPVTTMDRAMYTAHPPVKAEVDERNREAVLHASAVAMAKRMYSAQQQRQQQKIEEEQRPGSAGTDSTTSPVMQYSNLQEAAYRLAQERLARLHEEHQRNRGIAEYYGTSPTNPISPSKRLSKLSGRITRRRASSDGDVAGFDHSARPGTSDDDRQKSRQIRKQMSLFTTRLDEVDEGKRTRDREALLAAAQRNVKAALEGMDQKMYRETGRVTPAKLSEWEVKARAAALARSEARLAGGDASGGEMVNLGAGQYMDREKVEEIAAKRVQPVLDEINEKAEAERQRIVALREEQEKKRREWEAEKAKNAEIKENAKKLKEQEKQRNRELKEEEKADKAEEKRFANQETHSPRDNTDFAIDGAAADDEDNLDPTTAAHINSSHRSPRLLRLHRGPFAPKLQTKSPPPSPTRSPASPDGSSPESATERVKNWFRSRLQKPRSRAASSGGGGFIGGHALRRQGGGSATSLSEHSASMREVAMAGRGSVSSEEDVVRERERARARARLSGRGENESDVGLDGMSPPRVLRDPARVSSRGSLGSSRDSKFVEIIE